MALALKVLFALTGLVPLFGLATKPPDTMLLVYTVYVAAYFGRLPLARLADRLPGPVFLHLLASSRLRLAYRDARLVE